jgi:hypothetical protein
LDLTWKQSFLIDSIIVQIRKKVYERANREIRTERERETDRDREAGLRRERERDAQRDGEGEKDRRRGGCEKDN